MAEPAPGLEGLLERVESCFRDTFGGSPEVLAWAPGRVNLIGEHTDYTGGLAMPAAVDRYVVAALRRGGPETRVYARDFDDLLRFPLGRPPPATGWRAYAAGAVQVFGEAAAALGRPMREGVEIAVLGDVPLGAGLSSSAAIECALLVGMRALYELPLDDLALVRRAQEIEHRFLGLKSGLLDQIASVFSVAGSVLLVDFRALSIEAVPADFGPWCWAVADSGTRRELAGSAYAERVASVHAGLAVLREAGLATHWREARLDDVARLGDGAVWARRMRHVITENERVLSMAEALVTGDMEAAGRLLVESHQSLRDDYQVSIAELDLLADTAIGLPGCAGARMMGGGFGGCTIQLVRDDAFPDFAEALSSAFEARFGRRAPVWKVNLVDGASSRRVG